MKTVKEVIDDLFDQAEALRVQASEAEAKGLALQEEVVALKTGLEQEVVFIGSWDCKTSPIGVCAFNSEKTRSLTSACSVANPTIGNNPANSIILTPTCWRDRVGFLLKKTGFVSARETPVLETQRLVRQTAW